MNSRKFICILHSPTPIGGRGTALPLGKHRLVQMDYLENSSSGVMRYFWPLATVLFLEPRPQHGGKEDAADYMVTGELASNPHAA
jgi:hypothetical protein